MGSYTILDGNGVSQTVTVPNIGQQISAASTPVVVASDQSAIPVTGSGNFAITAVALPLPTGAATSAGLLAINTTLGTPMQQTGGSVTISGTPTVNLGTVAGIALDATVSAMSAKLPATVGVKTSALSLSAALPSDQAAVPINSNPPQMFAKPAANTLSATGTIAFGVEGGCSYYISVTNPAATTSQFVGTVTFQSSIDGGSTWQAINAYPQMTPTAQPTTTTTTVGLWLIDAPAGQTIQLRANMTAYTSGTIAVDVVPYGQTGAAILLPWAYTVTSGQTLVGPIDATGFSEIGIQVSAVTTTVLTVQGTNDPSLTTWDTIGVSIANGGTAPALTITAAGTYRFSTGGYHYIRIQCTTTGTVLTVQGVVGRLGVPTNPAIVVGAGTLTTVGTVTTVTTVTTLANGQTAHSSPSTGSPVRVAGRVNTAVDTTLIAGDASDLFMTTSGALTIKQYAAPELDWQATSALTPLATTTSTALKAAGAAGVRNYCTAIQLFNTSATVSTNVAILDGATVVWAGYLEATTTNLPVTPVTIIFPTPLRGTAATAMNIQLGTTGASVYYNAQGYQAP